MLLRILILGDLPPYDGGSGYSGAELHNGLTDMGHRVVSIAPIYPDRQQGEAGSWIVGDHRHIEVGFPRAERMLSKSEEPAYWDAVKQACAAESFDVVFTNSAGFAPAGADIQDEFRIPHIAVVRGYPAWELDAGARPTNRLKAVVRALGKADAVVAVSDSLANCLSKHANIVCRVIKNSPVVPNSVASVLGFRERSGDVLFAGTLTKRKCPFHAMRICYLAARELRRVSLTLVGRGPYESAVREYAKKLRDKLDVSVMGFQPRAQVLELMARHRLLLLPSRFEGDPRVVREAAVHGVPSVVLRREWAKELNGGVCTYDDLRDGAAAVTRLLSDQVAWLTMSNKAVSRARERQPMHVFSEYKDTAASVCRSIKGPDSTRQIGAATSVTNRRT
jgi:glycosyltransferase involved in cell wall biosynthesis